MSGADWIILFFIFASVLHAAWEGFSQAAFGIAGLIAGYLLAAWHYSWLSRWFAPHVKSPWMGDIAGFLIIFVGLMFLAALIGRAARWLMRQAGLSGLDRFLGGVLGAVRGVLIVAVLLVGTAAFAPTAGWLQGSQLAPYFLVVGRAAIWLAPSELRTRFYQGLESLRQARGPVVPQTKPATH